MTAQSLLLRYTEIELGNRAAPLNIWPVYYLYAVFLLDGPLVLFVNPFIPFARRFVLNGFLSSRSDRVIQHLQGLFF